MSFAAAIEEATKVAVCGWLANGGNAAVATWIVNGSRTPMTAIAGAAAGLGLLALNYGCNYDPDAASGTSDFANGPCDGWDAYLLRKPGHPSYGAWYAVFWASEYEWVGWRSDGIAEFRNLSTGNLFQASDYDRDNGAEVGYGKGSTKTACTEAPTGSPEPYQPYTYVDATTNCSYVVEHEAFVIDDTGTTTPVLKISQGASTRASGGIIGGCNFNPVIVIPPGGGGGGGGGGIYPWEPGPDGPNGEPWWWPIATTAIGNLIAAGIKRLLDEIFQEREPGRIYRLVSVCETNANGEPISQSREVDIPPLPLLNAAIARLDALEVLLQGHKDFKQPVCPPSSNDVYTGTSYSVQFRSTEVSPFGDKRLRKALRYRDQSGKTLEEHRDHWAAFEWDSGPWKVQSTGLTWGRPEVWASSEAEGKRVLAHAASIAGVDLSSPDHKWNVSEVTNTRYGPVMRMRTHRDVNGRLWVSTRDDSNGLPFVAAQ